MMNFDGYPQVAADFMNDEHREFVTLVNTLEQGLMEGKRMEPELAVLVEHVKAHFAHEEREMEAARFPPFPVHQSEHQRVIALFEQQQASYQSADDNQTLLEFISNDVPAWFERHLNTMDTVTARFLSMH